MPRYFTEGFRVSRSKKIIRRQMASRKRRIVDRLDKFNFPPINGPVLGATNIQFELADRAVGTSYGGIGLVHQFVRELGLAKEIDQRLHLFKIHLPYHESDHVLSLAYNALCAGTCLQDLELRRQDEAYLNALGAERIPDPTTAGDFCRRFQRDDLSNLQAAIDAARLKVWARQPAEFFAEARIEADGTMVGTTGECKEGMDMSYKGVWGYHPLVLTLANTGEELRLINRSGNRPSHEGAAEKFDECIALCQQAGFEKIVLRGDTDFSQFTHLDRWHEQGVSFVFGVDCTCVRHILADDLPKSAWKMLERPARYKVKTKPRSKPKQVKQQIVEERGYKDIRLTCELVAEMKYRPGCSKQTYRLIVLRKELEVRHPREQRLFDDYRYFFYITNDWKSTPADIVFSANDRCNQENIVAQLNSVRALHAPVDNLLSNEAYMLCSSLAWNLKAWLALRLPDTAGRWSARHRAQKQKLLKMEFRTFVNSWMRIPCQVLKSGGRLICRLLAWNDWQDVFFRLAEQVCHPIRS
jgi:hypothetical protein